MHARRYSFAAFNARPNIHGSWLQISRSESIAPIERAKHIDCSSWPARAGGDQRLRQLRWRASASVDGCRIVEPSAHELALVRQRRVARVETWTNVSKEQVGAALRMAKQALDEGIVCEFELAARVEGYFNSEYGPPDRWRCFVGRSGEYGRSLVRSRSHAHVQFHVGLLPFLLFLQPELGPELYD